MVDEAEGHGYQRAKREAAYGWFLRWLMRRGDGGPHPEPPTETEPFDSEELRCFPPGRNEPAGPAMIEAVRRLARDLPPSPPRIDLEAVLGPMPSAPPARVELGDARLQRLLVPSEAGLDVPAFLLRPAGEVRGVLVALDDRGKEALASDPVVETAHARGWAVCGVDPRGIGESATDKTGWVFAVSLLLGENFVGRQAWDLGRVFEALGPPGAFPGKPVGLYARGENACLAATYAIARASDAGGSPLRWYLLRDGFLSFRAFLDRPRSLPASYRLLPEDRDRTTAFDREIPASFFAFDALRSFDLPQLLATSQAKGLIVNPRDGDRGRLPEEAARSLLPPSVRAVSAEEPGRRVEEFLQEVLGQVDGAAGRGAEPDPRGPSVVAPPPRWPGLAARRGARGGAGRDARAGRPVAGAGGQPEGEPGVGWGEDPRRLGAVPRTPLACPAGVARAALRQPRGPEGARHADAGRRRLPDREPRLREPAGAGRDRQPLSAGQPADGRCPAS